MSTADNAHRQRATLPPQPFFVWKDETGKTRELTQLVRACIADSEDLVDEEVGRALQCGATGRDIGSALLLATTAGHSESADHGRETLRALVR